MYDELFSKGFSSGKCDRDNGRGFYDGLNQGGNMKACSMEKQVSKSAAKKAEKEDHCRKAVLI